MENNPNQIDADLNLRDQKLNEPKDLNAILNHQVELSKIAIDQGHNPYSDDLFYRSTPFLDLGDYSQKLGDKFNLTESDKDLMSLYNNQLRQEHYEEKKRLAEEQGFVGEMWSALNLTLWDKLVGETISGIGWLSSFGDWDGNFLTDIGQAISEKAQDVWKIHVNPDSEAQGAFRPWDHEWWASNIPTIASFASMAIPAGGAVKGLSFAGKALGIASNASRYTKWAAKGVTTAAISRHIEGMMEGSQTYNTVYSDLISKGVSEEEAITFASEAASKNYLANLPLLITDIPQYLLLGRSNLFNQAVTSKRLASLIGKNPNIATSNVIKEFAGQTAMEGFEEGWQYVNGKLSVQYGDALAGFDNGTEFSDIFMDGEMLTSMFFGALGGGAFATLGGDVGRVIKEKITGKPDEALTKRMNEVSDRMSRMPKIIQQMGEAVRSGNTALIEQARTDAAFDLAISSAKFGNLDIAIEQLEALKGMDQAEKDKYELGDDFDANIDGISKKMQEAAKIWDKALGQYGEMLAEPIARRQYMIKTIQSNLDNLSKKEKDVVAKTNFDKLSEAGRSLFNKKVDLASADRSIAYFNSRLKQLEKEMSSKKAEEITEADQFELMKMLAQHEFLVANRERLAEEIKKDSNKVLKTGQTVKLDKTQLEGTKFEKWASINVKFLGESGDDYMFKYESVNNPQTLTVKKSQLADFISEEDSELTEESIKDFGEELAKTRNEGSIAKAFIDRYRNELKELTAEGFEESIREKIKERKKNEAKSGIDKDYEKTEGSEKSETNTTTGDTNVKNPDSRLEEFRSKTLDELLALDTELEEAELDGIVKITPKYELNRKELQQAIAEKRNGNSSQEVVNQVQTISNNANSTTSETGEFVIDNLPDNADYDVDEDKIHKDISVTYNSYASDQAGKAIAELFENPYFRVERKGTEPGLILNWKIDFDYLNKKASSGNSTDKERFTKIQKALKEKDLKTIESLLIHVPIIGEIENNKTFVKAYMRGEDSVKNLSPEVYQELLQNKMTIVQGYLKDTPVYYSSEIIGRGRGFLEKIKQDGSTFEPIGTKVTLNSFDLMYSQGGLLYGEDKKPVSDTQINKTNNGRLYLKVKTANGENFPMRVFTRKLSGAEVNFIVEFYKKALESKNTVDFYKSKIDEDLLLYIKDSKDPELRKAFTFVKDMVTNEELLSFFVWHGYDKSKKAENKLYTAKDRSGKKNVLIVNPGDVQNKIEMSLEDFKDDNKVKALIEAISTYRRQVNFKDFQRKGFKEYLHGSDIIVTNNQAVSKNKFFIQPFIKYGKLFPTGKNVPPVEIKDTSAKVVIDPNSALAKSVINDLNKLFKNSSSARYEYQPGKFTLFKGFSIVKGELIIQFELSNFAAKVSEVLNNPKYAFLTSTETRSKRINNALKVLSTGEPIKNVGQATEGKPAPAKKQLDPKIENERKDALAALADSSTKKIADLIESLGSIKDPLKQAEIVERIDSYVVDGGTLTKGQKDLLNVLKSSLKQKGIKIKLAPKDSEAKQKIHDKYNQLQKENQIISESTAGTFTPTTSYGTPIGPELTTTSTSDIEIEKVDIVQTYEFKGKTQIVKKQTSTKDGITKVNFAGERSDKPGVVITTSGYIYGGPTSNSVQQFFDDYGITVEDIAEDLSIDNIKAIKVLEERTGEGKAAITFKITYSQEMGGMSSEPMEMVIKKPKFTSNKELAILESKKSKVITTPVSEESKFDENNYIENLKETDPTKYNAYKANIQRIDKSSLPETVKNQIKQTLYNSLFFELTADEKFYFDKRNPDFKYNRVTSVISDEVVDDNNLIRTANALGNKVDVLVRDFFNNELKSYDQYELIEDEESFNDFVSQLNDIKKTVIKDGDIVIASGITLFNEDMKVAGTPDIFILTKDGDIKIFDTKSMRTNTLTYAGKSNNILYDSSYKGKLSNREKHTRQLNLYSIIAFNNFGLDTIELGIIPVKVQYQELEKDYKKVKTTELILIKWLGKGQLKPINIELRDTVTNYGKDKIKSKPISNPENLSAAKPIANKEEATATKEPTKFDDLNDVITESNTPVEEDDDYTGVVSDADLYAEGIDVIHDDVDNFITNDNSKVATELRQKEIDLIRSWLPDAIGIELSDAYAKILANGHIAAGSFHKNMIRLSHYGGKGLAYHEAFHAVFNSMTSNKERLDILTEARSVFPNPTQEELSKIMNLNKVSLAKAVKIYYNEQLAEEFREYVLTNNEEYTSGINKLFRNIKNFLKYIFNVSSRRERLYYKISKGKFKKAGIVESIQLDNFANANITDFVKAIENIGEESEKIIVDVLAEQDILKKDCITVKAANGLRSSFTRGSQWEIVKDLKGYPSHANGGVDIKFSEQGFSFGRNGADIKAEYGLVLPNISNYESE